MTHKNSEGYHDPTAGEAVGSWLPKRKRNAMKQ